MAGVCVRVQVYNDLDLIFGVDLSDQNDLKRVRDVVMTSLLNFMPVGVSKERMSGPNLSEAYVRKLVKVYDDANRWSLISLSNVRARNVELKFADRMRRQFEFSVDSFQVCQQHCLAWFRLFYRATASIVQRTVLLSQFRLSVRHVYYDKTKQRTADILIPHETAITLVF